MVGLTWWSRLAAVARTASRATSEANAIWGGCPCIKLGGVYASKGGVHVSAPFKVWLPVESVFLRAINKD